MKEIDITKQPDWTEEQFHQADECILNVRAAFDVLIDADDDQQVGYLNQTCYAALGGFWPKEYLSELNLYTEPFEGLTELEPGWYISHSSGGILMLDQKEEIANLMARGLRDPADF